MRFIDLKSSCTKDLDAKASHDIVNLLTLTSVRVTHQAGWFFSLVGAAVEACLVVLFEGQSLGRTMY